MNLPVFELRPLNMTDKPSGNSHIDFDEDPGFSESYFLLGNDESGIRNIFTQAVRSFFKLYKDRYVEGHGNSLLYCILRERIGLGTMQLFLNEANMVYRLFVTENS